MRDSPLTSTELEDFIQAAVRLWNPAEIVLFGSYAYGTPRPDSDIDILLINDWSEQSWKLESAWEAAVNPRTPLNTHFLTEAMVVERLEWGDFFLREAVERGTTRHLRNGTTSIARLLLEIPEWGNRPAEALDGWPAMPPRTRHWLRLAEGAYSMALYMRESEIRLDYAICQHAHWTAHCSLKAWLAHQCIRPPKGRDLVQMARMLPDFDPEWLPDVERLTWLTETERAIDQDNFDQSYVDAEYALLIAALVRLRIRLALGWSLREAISPS